MLLHSAPQLKILATSREALGIAGESTYPVRSLSLPDPQNTSYETLDQYETVRLFIDRAVVVQPNFQVTNQNASAVTQVCSRLDGIPLAIELAAARVKGLSVEQIASRLDDRFRLLTGGSRTALPRQRTLQATIDWSYKLLSEEERVLLCRLSVFVGGWTLEAAEQVCASDTLSSDQILDLLLRLVDKSLVIADTGASEPRYHMLETIRQYAQEKLDDGSDGTHIRARHLDYFLHLAEQADKEAHGPNQVEWMDCLDRELENTRAALDWGYSSEQPDKLLRLLAASGWTWLIRWPSSEYKTWVEKIHALPVTAANRATFAKILNISVHQEWIARNFDEAKSLDEESQAICRELGSNGKAGLAEALSMLGLITEAEGKIDDSIFCYERGFELYQECGDVWGMAFAMFLLGGSVLQKGDDNQSLRWLNQSMENFKELGDPWGMARVSQRLGELYLNQGAYEKARIYFDQHLRLDEGLHFKQGVVVALANLGTLYRCLRDFKQAQFYYKKGMELANEYNFKINRGYNLYSLGMLALQQNQFSVAKRYFTEYFNSDGGFAEKISACDLLLGSAAIAAGAGQPERSALLYGAAQTIFETTDYRLPLYDQAEFDRHIQIARDQLGDAKFDKFAAEGRSMTLEQAIADALEESDG